MDRTEKEEFVADLQQRLGRAPVVYLTDFTGLDVKSLTILRQNLKDVGAEFLVVKNRLAMRALEDMDLPDLTDVLTGPTGLVFGYEGAVEPAKTISDFAKEHDDRPVFKVGVLDKALLEPQQITRLAKLPPRDQLLAELAGGMEGVMQAFVGVLQAMFQETSGLLEALRATKEEDGEEGEEGEEEEREQEEEKEQEEEQEDEEG